MGKVDEKLRDSLMEWYLRFGERSVNRAEEIDGSNTLHKAYFSSYITFVNYDGGGSNFKITPAGIEALKNG